MEMTQKRIFGQKLKALRLERNLTQQQVADMIGLKNKSTLATWECGKCLPNADVFLHLCGIYGVAEAADLVKRASLQDAIAYDFSAIADNTDPKTTDKKPYAFCPYCGEKIG